VDAIRKTVEGDGAVFKMLKQRRGGPDVVVDHLGLGEVRAG
jgi:hypothetical protein